MGPVNAMQGVATTHSPAAALIIAPWPDGRIFRPISRSTRRSIDSRRELRAQPDRSADPVTGAVKVATGEHDDAEPALSTTNLPPHGLSAAATRAGISSSNAPSWA